MMSKVEIIVQQMPAFKKAYKKLHRQQKLITNKAIHNIIENPALGDPKKGDLAGVYVYKYKIESQEMLLAYEWDPKHRLLMALGVHENFYRDLKKKNLK
jgi:mRNA-degrading endonuclease RelE of RelBE toxin-antitoxin system